MHQEQRHSLHLTDAMMAILLRRDIELVELLSAFGLLGWGLWLANPWTAVFAGTRAYALMSDVAPEWVWASVYVLFGLVQYLSLLSGRPRLRQSGCMAALAGWTCIAYMVARGNPTSTGIVTYGLLALANLVLLLRLEIHHWFTRRRGR